MFDITSCYDSFATEPNTAYFWSGLGNHGAEIAEKIAGENGGVTLEMVMEKNKDSIIAAGFDYNEDLGGFYFTRNNSDDWKAASQAYAEQASGDVHAVLGDNVREGSVWNTKEFPALEKNDNVDKVVSVDPSTGKEKDILLDKGTGNNSIDAPPKHSNSPTEKVSQGGGSQAPPSNADTTQIKGKLPEQNPNSQAPQNSSNTPKGELPQQNQAPNTRKSNEAQQGGKYGTTPDQASQDAMPNEYVQVANGVAEQQGAAIQTVQGTGMGV